MELLNGKAKELFWEWFLKQETLKKHKLDTMLKFSNEASVKVHVYSFPEVCQNALIIEWLDSIGYNIIITPYATCITLGDDLVGLDGTWSFFIYKSKKLMSDGVDFESRQEATTEAIKKAVELINESNGK